MPTLRPSPDGYRSIVALAKANDALSLLQADHERAARRAGLPAETRKFVPHVTLARLRSGSALAVANYLGSRGVFASRTFTVESFVLYSSRASTGGGPYVAEAEIPLRSSNAEPQQRHA